MAAVCRCLSSLRTKWNILGVFLGIEYNLLEEVRADNGTSDDRMRSMVKVWLQRTTPPSTWQALADAVEYVNPKQAEKIRQNIV